MYALISTAVVDHVPPVSAKHCAAFMLVSLSIRSTTSSPRKSEKSSLVSQVIGTAGPLSLEKGSTVIGENSLLHPV